MTFTDAQGRPRPPEDGQELETLLGFLEYQRATFGWKTRGLDAAQLRHAVAPSPMTLGGLVKHLALVEEYWFSKRLLDLERSTPFAEVDWDADPDWEWHSAADDTPEALHALWARFVEQSREHVAVALEQGGLDAPVRNRQPGDAPSLRWVLFHMIEEYARHNGHADYLREAADGSTGE